MARAGASGGGVSLLGATCVSGRCASGVSARDLRAKPGDDLNDDIRDLLQLDPFRARSRNRCFRSSTRQRPISLLVRQRAGGPSSGDLIAEALLRVCELRPSDQATDSRSVLREQWTKHVIGRAGGSDRRPSALRRRLLQSRQALAAAELAWRGPFSPPLSLSLLLDSDSCLLLSCLVRLRTWLVLPAFSAFSMSWFSCLICFVEAGDLALDRADVRNRLLELGFGPGAFLRYVHHLARVGDGRGRGVEALSRVSIGGRCQSAMKGCRPGRREKSPSWSGGCLHRWKHQAVDSGTVGVRRGTDGFRPGLAKVVDGDCVGCPAGDLVEGHERAECAVVTGAAARDRCLLGLVLEPDRRLNRHGLGRGRRWPGRRCHRKQRCAEENRQNRTEALGPVLFMAKIVPRPRPGVEASQTTSPPWSRTC